jgi:hypothetical protein
MSFFTSLSGRSPLRGFSPEFSMPQNDRVRPLTAFDAAIIYAIIETAYREFLSFHSAIEKYRKIEAPRRVFLAKI